MGVLGRKDALDQTLQPYDYGYNSYILGIEQDSKIYVPQGVNRYNLGGKIDLQGKK